MSALKDVHYARQRLNQDFLCNAKIKGLVSMLYFPGQSGFFTGHVELEVDGRCYTVMGEVAQEVTPLCRRVRQAREGGLPFFRTAISVTPSQLASLETDLLNRYSVATCMQGASQVLSQRAQFNIPLPVYFSPLLSFLYLRIARAMGGKRIGQVESYGSVAGSLRNILSTSVGVAGELYLSYRVCKLAHETIIGTLTGSGRRKFGK